MIPEIEETPPVAVVSRDEPPAPVEYQSLADHYVPDGNVSDGAVVRGLRVQLYVTPNSASADSFAAKAEIDLDFPIYIIFDPPNYKVRAGNFADRTEAVEAETIIRRRGYEAFIVPDDLSTEDTD